jgi:hypothetical protein
MLMHNPQFGLPSMRLLVSLWVLHMSSLSNWTNGEDLDHSAPVIA